MSAGAPVVLEDPGKWLENNSAAKPAAAAPDDPGAFLAQPSGAQDDPAAWLARDQKPTDGSPSKVWGGPSISPQNPFYKFGAEYAAKTNPITQAKGLWETLNQKPEDALHGYEQQQQRLLQRATDAWDQGDHMGAVAHGLYWALNGIPGVGAALDEAGNKFRNGDPAGGLADTAGVATNLALAKYAPEAYQGAKNTWKYLNEADPRVGMAREMKPLPGAKQSNFPETIEPAMRDIKQYGAGGGDIPTNDAQLNAATNGMIATRQAYDQWMARMRPRGAFIDGSPIIAATKNIIPKSMWRGNPAGAAAIMKEAQDVYGGMHSVDDLEGYLEQKNGELASLYDQSMPKQGAVLQSGGSKAILDAQADAIRDALYRSLDPENAGAGPRELQLRFGAMKDVWKDADKARIDVLKQQPFTKIGAAGKTGAALFSLPGKFFKGDVEEGLLNVVKPFRGETNPIIQKSYEAIGPARPLPLPPRPPQAGTLGALPPGTAPYTQGIVVPDIAGRPGPMTGRMLEAGPQPIVGGPREMPIEDWSYVKSTGPTFEELGHLTRKMLPQGTAPYTQGTVVPDIAGRPGPMTGRMVEPGPQPIVGGPHQIPPTETSGTVPGYRPYQHPGGIKLPEGVIPPARRLPPGAIRMPPTQVEIGSRAGDLTDMIPIKDPTTGQINWVPRPPKLTGQAKGGIAKSDGRLQEIERRAYDREATLRSLRR